MGKIGKLIQLVIGIAIAAVIGISIGVLIGWFSGPARQNDNYAKAVSEAPGDISSKLIDLIDAEKIRQNLKYLTTNPHVAGTQEQLNLAEWVSQEFENYGFDHSEIVAYNVLLSYPSEIEGEENSVQRLKPRDGSPGEYDVDFTSQVTEKPLDENSMGRDDILGPFNAYSAAGIETGDLVYANYARVEDFFYLERDLNISVADKIVIARYGKIYRGDKAKFAAQFYAKGLILYSDPSDYTIVGEPVYPNGIYLPGTGTQRGSCLDGNGDPLTPGYPSIESAYRLPEENVTNIPTIPVHPIGYDDAQVFLKDMDGEEVGEDWRGSLPNVTYRYGPGFKAPLNEDKVRMNIYTKNERRDGWNVIGTIKGSIEPDRYVIMGNHRDAWAFGAIDPSSGTAAMMEVARAFGQLLSKGWRPRRTVKFCSWGAEEYGLIGSNEWVEEFSKNLDNRAVAYLNLDIAVSGTFIPDFSSTPNLYQTIWDAAKLVDDPNAEQTMYDRWKAASKADGDPHIGDLGSGSDYAPFLQIVGVSAMDYTYVHDFETEPISPYPMYHSVYETFDLVEKFYDPNFYFHRASARVFGEILRNLADSKIIPMSCLDYANAIRGFFESLRDGPIGERMIEEGLSFDSMEAAVDNLIEQAELFESRVSETNGNDLLAVRRVNDQIMNFDRSFIDPLGLPGRPTTRHIVFAPSSRDTYSSDKFAGIVDTMFDIDNNPDQDRWEYVKQQLAAVTYALNSAAYSLQDVAFTTPL